MNNMDSNNNNNILININKPTHMTEENKQIIIRNLFSNLYIEK